MRDTAKDTDRISNIWRWIHNNIPGEPSRSDEDIDECVIRLLKKGMARTTATRTPASTLPSST